MRMFLAIFLFPAAAAAQGFQLPDGCSGFLTVQQKGCVVSNHYTCEQDADGDQWRIDFTEQGPTYAARINFETEWVESISLGSGEVRALEGADDPASLTELMESGEDTYDFTTRTDQGVERQWVGADRLRGRVEEIDGITLEVMDFESRLIDPESGEVLFTGVGVNYVYPEFRLFLPGAQTTFFPDGEQASDDNTPVDLIFPGEPGFFATRPIYECGADLAAFTR